MQRGALIKDERRSDRLRAKQLGGTLPLLGELQPLMRQLFVAPLAFFVPAAIRELPAFRLSLIHI